MRNVEIITARERMPLDEFIEMLWKLQKRLAGDRT